MTQVDIRTLYASEKQAAISVAGGLPCMLAPDKQLEHPELAAAWDMVKLRGRHVGDSTANCVYLEPATAEVLRHQGVAAEAVEQKVNRNIENFKKLL